MTAQVDYVDNGPDKVGRDGMYELLYHGGRGLDQESDAEGDRAGHSGSAGR